MEQVSANRCHGGMQGVYTHRSAATGTAMTFAVFAVYGLFAASVRDIRMLRIEELNDLMPVVQRVAGMTGGEQE